MPDSGRDSETSFLERHRDFYQVLIQRISEPGTLVDADEIIEVDSSDNR
jgi:hypothetical protein